MKTPRALLSTVLFLFGLPFVGCDNEESAAEPIGVEAEEDNVPLADLNDQNTRQIPAVSPPAPDTSAPEPSDFGMVIEEKNSALNEDVYTIYLNQFIPEGCTNETPCPSVVLVPDKIASGDAFFGEETPRWLAAKTRAVVVTYNPPGRGEGGRISTGDEDYNGPLGQDALSDVINFILKSPITTNQTGVISFGYGLISAAGALSRFKTSKLKDVNFLIDIEGPINRCFATSSPFDEDSGIDGDGPGDLDGRCDFDVAERMDAFPLNLPANAPPAMICNQQAFPLKQAETSCEDDQWWNEREPKLYLKSIRTNYLRIQMRYDHRQASRWSALKAIKFVISSDAEKHYLNSQAPNQAHHSTGDSACLENGCYLDFTEDGLGNSLRFPECFEGNCVETENPYSAAFENFKSMSIEEFAQYILPQYIEQLFN